MNDESPKNGRHSSLRQELPEKNDMLWGRLELFGRGWRRRFASTAFRDRREETSLNGNRGP